MSNQSPLTASRLEGTLVIKMTAAAYVNAHAGTHPVRLDKLAFRPAALRLGESAFWPFDSWTTLQEPERSIDRMSLAFLLTVTSHVALQSPTAGLSFSPLVELDASLKGSFEKADEREEWAILKRSCASGRTRCRTTSNLRRSSAT